MFKVLLAVFSYAWITDAGPQAVYPEKAPEQNNVKDKKEVLKTLDQYSGFKKLTARL